MFHLTRTSFVTVLFVSQLAACTTQTPEPGQLTERLGGPTLMGGAGKGDSPASNDTRQVGCALDYETFTPTFASARAASVVTTYGDLATNGASIGDARYALYLDINPDPNAPMPVNVLIGRSAGGAPLSYVTLPTPVDGGYFVELGTGIPPQQVTADGTTGTFDFVRGYCSISQ